MVVSQPTIRNDVPFSQSKLWDMQSRFYQEAGIDAWNNKIPYKITNNLTIAHSYITTAKTLDTIRLKPFIDGMHRCGEHFYPLPGYPSTLINVGSFFYAIEDFAAALAYYERSVEYREERTELTFKDISCRISLCRCRLKREALLESDKKRGERQTSSTA